MTTNPDTPEKKPIGAELIIPVGGLGFTLYYFWTIIDSPWTAQVNAFLVGSILVVLLVIFLVRAGLELASGRASLGMIYLLQPLSLLPRRLGFAGLTLAYLGLMDWTGFTLGTFAFLSLSMMLLNGGKRKAVDASLGAGMALIGYLVFIVLFTARFPKGPFEHLIEWVK